MAALPPTAREILNRPGSPHMPAADVRFALLTRPNHFGTKPVAFESLDALAASLHRRRRERLIWMLDAALTFEGEARARKGVSVWAVGLDGAATDFLGWCWIDGAGQRELTAALDALVPNTPALAEAA